ncbi:hypothetical protein LINPERPRIM_LOCUS15737 [Linum perenne]
MAANLRISHLLLLLLLTLSATNNSRPVEARTLPFSSSGSSKFFATLGVVCKCCDNRPSGNGECSSSWEGSCRDVQCLPWRIG